MVCILGAQHGRFFLFFSSLILLSPSLLPHFYSRPSLTSSLASYCPSLCTLSIYTFFFLQPLSPFFYLLSLCPLFMRLFLFALISTLFCHPMALGADPPPQPPPPACALSSPCTRAMLQWWVGLSFKLVAHLWLTFGHCWERREKGNGSFRLQSCRFSWKRTIDCSPLICVTCTKPYIVCSISQNECSFQLRNCKS